MSRCRRRHARRYRLSVQAFGTGLRYRPSVQTSVKSSASLGAVAREALTRCEIMRGAGAPSVGRSSGPAGEAGATGADSAARPEGRRRQRRVALGARPSAPVVDRAHRRDDDASASIRARPIPLHSGMGKSVPILDGSRASNLNTSTRRFELEEAVVGDGTDELSGGGSTGPIRRERHRDSSNASSGSHFARAFSTATASGCNVCEVEPEGRNWGGRNARKRFLVAFRQLLALISDGGDRRSRS